MTDQRDPLISQIAAIEVVIHDYLDGIHFGDLAKLRHVMHADCRMISVSKETYANTDMETYFEAVESRRSPHEVGEPREDRILEISGPDDRVATVRLECLVLGKACHDTLTLMRTGNRWSIISKVFSYERRAA